MRESASNPLLERMTDDARAAATLALEESRVPGDAPLDSAHLLLGLLRHEGTFAARALASLGVTVEDAREQVDALIEDKDKGKREDRKARAARRLREDWRDQAREASLTPRPENILELALHQAEISGRYYIGTVHLLRGLIQEPEGVAARALANLGVETQDVHRRVIEMLRAGEYQEKKRGGLHNFDRKGRKGTGIRLELLDNDKLARELNELLILTGIVEIPDENSSPPGLPSGQRNEPPEAPMDDSLHARIERAVEQLGIHIEMMRDDRLGLERAHRMLFGLIDDKDQDGEIKRSRDD
ncbi:MAG: Clp protease N-terminal domain-containing protein [Rubrobacteraceae bacterium]